MPLVDTVHQICVLRRRASALAKEQLALNLHMATPEPDINLSATRAVDIVQNAACLAQTCHQR
jgi:hypothetical protein